MDKKKLEKRNRILLVILAVCFGLILSRLVYLQVIDAARYQTLATMNHVRLVTVPAPRGEVYDRHGVRLVGNRPVFVLKTANRTLDSGLLNDLLELIGQDANFRGKITPGELEKEFRARLKAARPHEYIVIAKDVTRETVEKIMEQQEKYQSIVIDVEPIRYYPFGDLGGEVFGYVR
ncbi:MAG: penicillin-binding protein 2, partial [Bacillota bacterium]